MDTTHSPESVLADPAAMLKLASDLTRRADQLHLRSLHASTVQREAFHLGRVSASFHAASASVLAAVTAAATWLEDEPSAEALERWYEEDLSGGGKDGR